MSKMKHLRFPLRVFVLTDYESEIIDMYPSERQAMQVMHRARKGWMYRTAGRGSLMHDYGDMIEDPVFMVEIAVKQLRSERTPPLGCSDEEHDAWENRGAPTWTNWRDALK